MKKTIKNIIFDFGGVLVDLDKQVCVDAFGRIGANAIACYVDECRQEDLFHDLELGTISIRQFCDEARRQAQCEASDEAICNAWNALLTTIPLQRLEALQHLRTRYRLLLLSNTNAIHWQKATQELFTADGGCVDDYFEKTYLSYELHQLKPSPEIFRHVLHDADIKAEETLFIDDSATNCEGARQTGIQVLHAVGDEWLEKLNDYKVTVEA